MSPIDSSTLPGLPAPFWFIQFFKIVGFVLHCLPMSVWFVGLPMALLFLCIGRRNARRYAKRLLKELPVLMALGINFGIVPLLFIQTAYYKAFYTSTVLMACHWFMVIILVGLAYYALYGCSFLVERGKTRKLFFCGLFATACLWGVSLIFASQWTLMESPDQWQGIWEKTCEAGAVSGWGTYWRSPLVFLRWGMTLGVAVITFAFWTVFDAWVLCRARSFVPEQEIAETKSNNTKTSEESDASGSPKASKKEKKKQKKQGGKDDSFDDEYAALEALEKAEQAEKEESARKGKKSTRSESGESARESVPDTIEHYRAWSVSLAASLSWLGLLLAGGTFQYLYFRVLDPNDPNFTWLYSDPWKYLPWGTLAAFFLPAFLLTLGKWGKIRGGFLVFLLTLAELAVLGSYATTRQMLQNSRLIDWLDVSAISLRIEWSPLYAFLGTFAVALILILWMIRQMVITGRPPKEEQEE